MYELIAQRSIIFSKMRELVKNGMLSENVHVRIRMVLAKDYARLLKSYNKIDRDTFNKKLVKHVMLMTTLMWDSVKQIQLKDMSEIGVVKSTSRKFNIKGL